MILNFRNIWYEFVITNFPGGVAMLRTSLLILLLVLVGCSGDESNKESEKESVETKTEATAISDKGQELYNQKCANCHGQNLEGIVGTELTTTGSKFTEEQLLDIIVNGIEKTTMPGGLLEGEEAEAVAKWLAQQK